MTLSPPKNPTVISYRATAKVTWDWNSVGIEIELTDEVRAEETPTQAKTRIKKWVSDAVQEDLSEFKEEVAKQYVPKRKSNR